MASELTDITAKLVHQTGKAILINDGDEDIWLPLSMIEFVTTDASKGIVEVTLPLWLAKDKGLI